MNSIKTINPHISRAEYISELTMHLLDKVLLLNMACIRDPGWDICWFIIIGLFYRVLAASLPKHHVQRLSGQLVNLSGMVVGNMFVDWWWLFEWLSTTEPKSWWGVFTGWRTSLGSHKCCKRLDTMEEKSIDIKGIVHPKIKFLSSFTHLQVVSNLYEFLYSSEHKWRHNSMKKILWKVVTDMFQNIFFCDQKKKYIFVCNDLRLSKWWQNFYFRVNYPFKHSNRHYISNLKWSLHSPFSWHKSTVSLLMKSPVCLLYGLLEQDSQHPNQQAHLPLWYCRPMIVYVRKSTINIHCPVIFKNKTSC